jgi:hypothetical protein
MAQADPRDRKALVVSASQTLSAMGTIQAALLEALLVWDSVVVDCSVVAEADLSFVQTLIAGYRHAPIAAKHRALSPPSGALLSVLTRGGLLGTATAEEQAFRQQAECVA